MSRIIGEDSAANGFLMFCSSYNFNKFFKGTSNILVSNIYWIVAYKICVLFVSLNEESLEGCSRVSLFHLNEILFSSLNVLPATVNQIYNFLKVIMWLKLSLPEIRGIS